MSQISRDLADTLTREVISLIEKLYLVVWEIDKLIVSFIGLTFVCRIQTMLFMRRRR